MSQAIFVNQTGGAQVLHLQDCEVGAPGRGEVLLKHTAIGVNYIDTYFRSGLYPSPNGLPFTPGNEAAGVVLAVGEGVEDVAVGQRVAYAGPLGAYSSERLIEARHLVAIPDRVSDEQAAAVMLKGMTAQYLLRQTYKVQQDDWVLFHAAAGGVGLLLGQWAASLGANVIGTVSNPAKAELARQHGYAHIINYSEEDFVARTAEITGGAKCHVVYDGVGAATFPGSLDCLRPRGMFVSFGQSSGPLPSFDLGLLAQKGSLFATRPSLFAYTATREALLACAGEMLEKVADSTLQICINQRFKLAEASQAHVALEGRQTTGATLLLP
ncbi:quinone oxidoreductase family protein [Polycladidibacter hongkongensis]|uniref:quinone oxidoreductase family protein n=1 Tax=Polycladidibacter hongkongensis TaxID=1647556 RepID=UPI0008347F14|nr:quinone oxidoreductase [Pseudovibrio hongkongensis]